MFLRNFSRNAWWNHSWQTKALVCAALLMHCSINLTVQRHPVHILYPSSEEVCELSNVLWECAAALYSKEKAFKLTQLRFLWVLSFPVFWWHLIYTNPSWFAELIHIERGVCVHTFVWILLFIFYYSTATHTLQLPCCLGSPHAYSVCQFLFLYWSHKAVKIGRIL